MYWQEDELCIEVDLAWWTSDGCLAPAPWRLQHRERIVAGLKKSDWAAVYSPDLPPGSLTDSPDDEVDPPLAPDLKIPARVGEAVRALYCPAPEQWEISVGAAA